MKSSKDYVGITGVEALKIAYRKHFLDDATLNWDDVRWAIYNALITEIGEKNFEEWRETLK
jgi:hypothetical protein